MRQSEEVHCDPDSTHLGIHSLHDASHSHQISRHHRIDKVLRKFAFDGSWNTPRVLSDAMQTRNTGRRTGGGGAQ